MVLRTSRSSLALTIFIQIQENSVVKMLTLDVDLDFTNPEQGFKSGIQPCYFMYKYRANAGMSIIFIFSFIGKYTVNIIMYVQNNTICAKINGNTKHCKNYW